MITITSWISVVHKVNWKWSNTNRRRRKQM